MPKCKICGQPVIAALVACHGCQKEQAQTICEELCDKYCVFPHTVTNQHVMDMLCEGCTITEKIMDLAGGRPK